MLIKFALTFPHTGGTYHFSHSRLHTLQWIDFIIRTLLRLTADVKLTVLKLITWWQPIWGWRNLYSTLGWLLLCDYVLPFKHNQIKITWKPTLPGTSIPCVLGYVFWLALPTAFVSLNAAATCSYDLFANVAGVGGTILVAVISCFFLDVSIPHFYTC